MPSPTQTSLERRLGPLDGAAIIVANVIGGGIFFLPPVVASMLPHPVWFLSTWVAGGVLAFFGAVAYAELAALRPRAGGEYVYLREAYGPLAGFMTGWTSFVTGFSGAMAASAIFFMIVLNRFIPGVANPEPFFVIPLPYLPLTFSPHTLMAMALVWLFAWVHVGGVGPGRLVMNVLAVLKVATLIVFIALGFTMGTGSTANFQQAAGSVSATNWLLALVPVMFTYSGWNAASYMAEEIQDPGRNVPLALLLGTIAVIAIYALLNGLYLYAMPVTELAAVKGSVFDLIGERILGARAGADSGDCHAGQLVGGHQRVDVRRSAHLLRDGARRRVFSSRRTGASAIQDAARVDRGAGVVDEHPDSDRQSRHAFKLRRVCDYAFCGHRRRGGVRAARARATRASTIQGAWVSHRARDFRHGQLCDCRQRLLSKPGTISTWTSRDRVRYSAVHVVDTPPSARLRSPALRT